MQKHFSPIKCRLYKLLNLRIQSSRDIFMAATLLPNCVGDFVFITRVVKYINALYIYADTF